MQELAKQESRLFSPLAPVDPENGQKLVPKLIVKGITLQLHNIGYKAWLEVGLMNKAHVYVHT